MKLGSQLRHSGVRALREVHNFSNGVHTLRQDEVLHGFVTLGSRLAI